MSEISTTPRRKPLRLKCYDYSEFGAYFVTVCTRQRELLLETPEIAMIIEGAWLDLPSRFKTVKLDEFIVMPNHVHFIIWLTSSVGAPLAAPQVAAGGKRGRGKQAPLRQKDSGKPTSAPTLGQVLRAFKSISAIGVNNQLGRSGRSVWQRNYYERVIRNDRELNEMRQYIRDNPLVWEHGKEIAYPW
jgi:putative transposase